MLPLLPAQVAGLQPGASLLEDPTHPKRLTENELSDFSWLCDDGCGKAIIEAQYVDRNHSTEI